MRIVSLLVGLGMAVSNIGLGGSIPFVQQGKLTALDGAGSDNLGISAACNGDGNTAILGAYQAQVGGNWGRGAAYVYTRAGTAWSEQEKLIAADGASGDNLGRSVFLSRDGNTAIVGANGADIGTNSSQGAAYIFTRAGTAWTQQAKLVAADGAAQDYFGYAVSLSDDGNTAIVGAYTKDVDGKSDQGAAYIFTRSGTTWTQQAKLVAADGAAHNYFGVSVALNNDGSTAIAGAYQADVGGNWGRGAAYVFTRSGTAWTEEKKLIATGGASEDHLGRSVALSSNGNTAIVGAYTKDVGGNADQGAAYVFTRSGTAWTQEAQLTAADGAGNDNFGYAVSLSDDGNTALAGAGQAVVGGNTNQGAAYVFTRAGTAWTQQAKLVAADGAAQDLLGRAVALNGDGYTAIAGAYQAQVGGNNAQGAGYVFAVPPPPTGIAASYDFYIDRVQVSWIAAASAAGYEVWRGTSDDTNTATSIGTGIAGTNYDDTSATAGTPYYYWVKTTNANGTSAFSASALGRRLFGPDVRINGEAGPLTLAAGSALVVTISMNPGSYEGYPMDWWVVASAAAGMYYLNGSLVWTPASGLGDLQPVYQGGLMGVQSYTVLSIASLPAGTYVFYFGVDTHNGVLDPDVVYDSATVTISP